MYNQTARSHWKRAVYDADYFNENSDIVDTLLLLRISSVTKHTYEFLSIN